jgi:hypothetical protein
MAQNEPTEGEKEVHSQFPSPGTEISGREPFKEGIQTPVIEQNNQTQQSPDAIQLGEVYFVFGCGRHSICGTVWFQTAESAQGKSCFSSEWSPHNALE